MTTLCVPVTLKENYPESSRRQTTGIVISTTFSKQVREGVLIGKTGTSLDIVMFSKAEILGT